MYLLSGFTDCPEALYHPVFLIGFLYRENGGFPGGSDGNRSACDGDLGLIPGSGRSPGKGNGNPLQYSCLEHPMDRGAQEATVHGVAKSETRLSLPLLFTYAHLYHKHLK